jgi:hypothetical protein
LWMILWTTISALQVRFVWWHLVFLFGIFSHPLTDPCHASVLATGFTERGYENYMKEAVSLDQFNDVRQEQQQYASPSPRESAPAPAPAPASYQQGPSSPLDSPDKVPGFLKNLKKRR